MTSVAVFAGPLNTSKLVPLGIGVGYLGLNSKPSPKSANVTMDVIFAKCGLAVSDCVVESYISGFSRMK